MIQGRCVLKYSPLAYRKVEPLMFPKGRERRIAAVIDCGERGGFFADAGYREMQLLNWSGLSTDQAEASSFALVLR